MTIQREVEVDRNGYGRDNHHDSGCHAHAGHPCRERTTDEAACAGPGAEEEKGPESQKAEVLAIDSAPNCFGDEIKGGCQSHGCEPEVEETAGEPCGDGWLRAGLDGLPDEQLVGCSKKPGE